MERKTEREWKSIRCPEEEVKTLIRVERELFSKKGRILKKSLRQIDCHHPLLTQCGGADCTWGCERFIGKRET